MSDVILHNSANTELAALRPRERIVVTARELFQKHGVKGVGVDAIAETALTNKMTLYRHFGSKDDLIVECMQRAIDESLQWWDSLEAEHPGDARAQLDVWLARCNECLISDERGCEMATTAVELTEGEHPARKVIEAGKKQHRDRFIDLCRRAGLSNPEQLADTLWLLFEGARISRQSEGSEGPCAQFKRMAEAMIASADHSQHTNGR